MQSVIVCRCCGRTVEKEFLYCPWCGVSLLKKETGTGVIDALFDRLETVSCGSRERRISKLESSLQQLEDDLSLLISRHGEKC